MVHGAGLPTSYLTFPPSSVEMRGSLTLAVSLFALLASTLAFLKPDKIYGVNLGSWYVCHPHSGGAGN